MKLYRAMCESEWNEIQQMGEFRPGPPSFQGKWFAESEADALQWGNQLHQSSRFVVIEISVDLLVANQLFRLPWLDRIGPARFADVPQLPLLTGSSIQLIAKVP